MKTKTLIITSLLIASLHAQNQPQADPYSASPANVDDPFDFSGNDENLPDEKLPVNISICYEAFSLPLAMAAELQREQHPDPALYAKLISELGKEFVRQEVIQIVRLRSGDKATTESISEHVYPTEYESATSGNTAAPEADSAPGVAEAGGGFVPGTPTAFETRNLGNSLEVQAVLSEDRRFVDFRVAPELVTLAGNNTLGQQPSTLEVEMPEFESQRVRTAVTVRVDQPHLIGTFSRPPVSKIDPDSANRVWFAFVTATLVMP